MKFLLAAVAVGFSMNAAAQDNNMFNHLSVAYTLGTDGLFGIDVASPIGNYVAVRAGYTFHPKFKVSKDIDYTYKGNQKSDEADFKLNMGNFKLLFDIYPILNNSFHFTAGAYIGGSKVIDVKNPDPLSIDPADYGGSIVEIGDNGKMFATDDNGFVMGRAKVNAFKPYIGVGFGRVVSNNFCNVSCDLGIMIWGKPKVEFANGMDLNSVSAEKGWLEVKKSDFNDHDSDGYKVLNTISKLSVWPVLNVRVAFKAF